MFLPNGPSVSYPDLMTCMGNLKWEISDTRLEDHYTPQQIAKMWKMSDDTICRIFESEPGVLIFQNPERSSKRRRRMIRIPHSVYESVKQRLSSR
jgi:hypothetical protein